MAKTNKTIVIFIIFVVILMQAFLFVNEKIQKNQIAFDEKSHAYQNTSLIETQKEAVSSDTKYSIYQNEVSNLNENNALFNSNASYKSLFPGLYEIPDLIKVNPDYEYITDYKIKDINTAVVTTDKSLYIKIGNEIKKIPLDGIPSNAYLSSCEMTKLDGEYYVFIGTSYSGLYAKAINDNKFFHFYTDVKRSFYTSEQSLFFETITALFIKDNQLFIGYQSSKGIDILDLKSYYSMRKDSKLIYKIKRTLIEIKDPINQNIKKFYQIGDDLYVYTNFGIYKYEDDMFIIKEEFKEDEEIKDNGIRGIYLSSFAASSRKKIDSLIELAKYCNLNTFVVDFKDDFGFLSYGSQIELSKKMKSTRNLIDTKYLLEKANENNIKIIARIVSFRDPIAFNYDNNKFAIWSKSKNAPWSGAKSIEKWIDPYNEEYLNYLLDIAKEIESLGVYEIQFDYIRFPAEGNISDIVFRYNEKNISKNSQIFNFIFKVKQNIHIPVSLDFFGYQCWYKISKHIGQDIFINSMIVDAIYPMYYPSHFSKGFYSKGLSQLESVKFIYKHGVIRAMENSGYKIAIRPWIQAFKLDVSEDYVSYIKKEIEGVLESGINSYVFWNPSSDYKVLYEVFKH